MDWLIDIHWPTDSLPIRTLVTSFLKTVILFGNLRLFSVLTCTTCLLQSLIKCVAKGFSYIFIKTQGSVSCSPRSWHAKPWVYWKAEGKKMWFRTSVAQWYLIQKESNLLQRCLPVGRLYIENCSSQSQDMPNFFTAFFSLHCAHFAKSTIKHKHIGTHKGLTQNLG